MNSTTIEEDSNNNKKNSSKTDAIFQSIKSNSMTMRTVDLSNCNLFEFPLELLCISSYITMLNFGGNKISILPYDMIQFQQLRILFFANNEFQFFPEILSQLKSLYMISFKSNKLVEISEASLSSSMEWLILTDNQLKQLPSSIGLLTNLKKCMLAGNRLTSLPDSMKNCRNLELIRLAANMFTELPSWLYELPKLSWIAFGGNPMSNLMFNNVDIHEIEWNNIILQEKLGEGASGVVHKGIWKNDNNEIPVAVKLFKGIATSDGLPEDEMKASIQTGSHPNCTKVHGKLIHCPMGLGLVLDLIDPTFKILGLPPSFDSITRDTYPDDACMEWNHIVSVAKGVASVCDHLHSKGISHGDLYAHNILVYNGQCLLSDFGAASFFDPSSAYAKVVQGFEVRAYGCLLEELIMLYLKSGNELKSSEILIELQNIQIKCMSENPIDRPSFKSMIDKLDKLITT